MGVIIWLLIPIGAVVVAMAWTATLARRERRRADEKWRAARLAERGAVLAADGGGSPGAAPGSPAHPSAQSAADGDTPVGLGHDGGLPPEAAVMPPDGHVDS